MFGLSALTDTIRRLFYAAFLFGLACGISLALTPILLSLDFDKSQLGLLGVANALGIVAMAVPAGTIAKKLPPAAALISFLAAYAVFDAALPFVHSGITISIVRFFDGACSVGVWVSSETILLGQTHDKDKANLTSLYAIWLSSGYVAGSIVASVMGVYCARSTAYVVSGGVALFAALYVAISVRGSAAATLSETVAPVVDHAVSDAVGAAGAASAVVEDGAPPALTLIKLLARIRCSCFATFVYGYFQAAVVLFLPSYLSETKGIDPNRTTLLPGIFCFGMLVASNPVGRLADKRGHLLIMRVLASVGLLFVLGFIFLDDWRWMYVAVFCAGGTLAAMSPVSLALQGVVTPPRDYARGNGLYNLWYASGILLGPPISGAIFNHFGGTAMLGALAAMWGAFAVFSLVYAADDPAYGLRRAHHRI